MPRSYQQTIAFSFPFRFIFMKSQMSVCDTFNYKVTPRYRHREIRLF